jgi:hypothetical protein
LERINRILPHFAADYGNRWPQSHQIPSENSIVLGLPGDFSRQRTFHV